MKVKNIMLCATAVVPSLAWAKELPNIIYIIFFTFITVLF